MLDKIGNGFRAYAPLVLRLGLAVIIVMEGAQWLRGSSSMENIILGGAEILCGVLILIGFLTRWAAATLVVLVVFMIIRGLGHYIVTDPDEHLWLAVLAMSLSVYFSGGGEMSVDLRRKRKEEK